MLSRKIRGAAGVWSTSLNINFLIKSGQYFIKSRHEKEKRIRSTPGLAYSKAEIYIQRFFILSFGLLTALGIFFTGEHVVYLLKSIFN